MTYASLKDFLTRGTAHLARGPVALLFVEDEAEIASTLADLAGVGVSIVTMGQYLRPTAAHLPVSHWWTPDDFDRFGALAREAGIAHAESSPFTRSSHHAAQAADAAAAHGAGGARSTAGPRARSDLQPQPG